jgi:hypothetical protein
MRGNPRIPSFLLLANKLFASRCSRRQRVPSQADNGNFINVSLLACQLVSCHPGNALALTRQRSRGHGPTPIEPITFVVQEERP